MSKSKPLRKLTMGIVVKVYHGFFFFLWQIDYFM